MNASSTAYIYVKSGEKKYVYHFTGVRSIEYNLALTLVSTSSQGSDIVNGARNAANKISMSVVETDTEHSDGWAQRMYEIMVSLKESRSLITVVTPLGTYKKMLLTEISALLDEENQYGWSGTLTFTQYIKPSDDESTVKLMDNSSVRTNTGSAGTVYLLNDTAFLQTLQRAGVV